MWGVLAGLGGAYAASQAADYTQVDPNQVASYLQPWASALGWDAESGDWGSGGLMGKALDFQNIGSDYNQTIRKETIGQAQDDAMVKLMGLERLGGDSGVIQQKGVELANNTQITGQEQFMKNFAGNQQLGANMQVQATSGLQDYTENIAQAYINNINNENAQNAAAWGGLSQGLFSFVPGLV